MTRVNSEFLLPAVPLYRSALDNSVLPAKVDGVLAVIFISLILAKHSEVLLSNIYSRNFVQSIHCFPVWSKSLLEERDIFLHVFFFFFGGGCSFFFFSADEIRYGKYRRTEVVEKVALC